MAEKKDKKWAQKVDLKEGSLKALGWPSGSAIASAVSSGRVSYASAISKLVYLANVNAKKNPETARKARAIIVRLQKAHGKKKPKGKK